MHAHAFRSSLHSSCIQERFKIEIGRMKGAPECMRIFRFMHGVSNPELTKRLNERVPKTVEEMMTATVAFIRGETAAASKKKGSNMFTPLTRTPREIFMAESGKFKPPPPMVTPVGKRSSNKFCEFHNDKGHSTDECVQLKKQIKELVRAGKLSQFIKDIRQDKDQQKTGKKDTPTKDKAAAIYMIQPWQRVMRQKVTQSFDPVREIVFPPLTASKGTEGPLVIEAKISRHMVHRMYVDGGSSMEVLFEHCFNRLRPKIKSQMVPATTSLTGFSGETIWPIGQLKLLVTIGDAEYSTEAWMNFMIVRSPSPYNGIIERPWIKEIQAVPSTAHGMIKFPVTGRIVTILAIHPDFPDQEISIGGALSAKGRTELCTLLKGNLDIFAWQPSDMTGVPRSIAEHKLNIREGYPPIRQKKRGQDPERAKAIQAEVQKLVEARIMREVYYHDWLSNPVMVKKHDGSWRMCVDFTDLNKACPQDCYPLPEIDWKVESLCGYPFKCFLDAYKGYHQIQMAEADEEKTAFHTPQGVYCYTKMPFGLKNAGATYQRLVDKAFDKQVGQNLEAYVDDLVIKSHTEAEIFRDIEETFRTLRKINMKLNPKKCTFEAVEGMFLGYVVGPEGIKPCPEKIDAVLQLPSPRTIKEVQSLNGKLAGLNRFLSKSAERSLPLFKTLKNCSKKSDFCWTPEAEKAFKELKQRLSELPTLVAPKPKEELVMYLSASHGAVGAVLMTERTTIQMPVYFISRALQGPELNYAPMEKLVLALVFAAKRLQRYFQAHPIAVITDQPLKQIMSRPDVAGRLQKWSVMLGEHNITYRPQTSVKGQILADFLVEKPEEAPTDKAAKEIPKEPWTLFTDGSSCVDGSGAGLILTSPEGTEFTYALRSQFAASNNEAEYEALIARLRIATQMGVSNIQANVDSKLVANQVLGTYVAKEDNMIKYLKKTNSLVSGFDSFSISQVSRSKNKKADALSKMASTSFAHLSKKILVEILKEKSIKEKEVAAVVEEEEPTWMTPIIEYLRDGTLPADSKDASKLRIKARQYELLKWVLYRRSFLKPWLRCKDCQIHRPVPRQPQQPLTPITAPWPFYKWGIDIAGPFPEGPGKVKFLIVAMDYFTKWIEAKAVATISGTQVKKANRSLGEGIKARLGEGNNNWLEELPHVLWAHRTMVKSSNDDTPFSLTYGTEAVVPAEIGMPTYRTAAVDAAHNEDELRLNLDLTKERRERAAIREAQTKLKMKRYYDTRVKNVAFRPGDFVYRSNDASHAVDGGKLGPKWKGPYEVMEALGDGAYRLRSADGTILPRTLNVTNLKKCYL
ncbi:reverse transcriptase domain-containing protein [Tanacetum coccineum]